MARGVIPFTARSRARRLREFFMELELASVADTARKLQVFWEEVSLAVPTPNARALRVFWEELALAQTQSVAVYAGALAAGAQYGRTDSFANVPANATSFESSIGKSIAIAHFGSSFKNADGNFNYGPTATELSAIRNRGTIPLWSWHPQQSSGGNNPNQPDFKLTALTAGDYDTYIADVATRLKNWGHPLFLRFMHEMNASWYPWGILANGNARADFVPAWRHVRGIFDSVGANNVTWFWCPNANNSAALTSLWPGAAYADWAGFDFYPRNVGGSTFAGWVGPTYNEIIGMVESNIPLMIGEWGVEDTESTTYITNVLSGILSGQYPRIRAHLYYNRDDGSDTDALDNPVGTSAKLTAYKTGIADARFKGAQYATISGKIQPPT